MNPILEIIQSIQRWLQNEKEERKAREDKKWKQIADRIREDEEQEARYAEERRKIEPQLAKEMVERKALWEKDQQERIARLERDRQESWTHLTKEQWLDSLYPGGSPQSPEWRKLANQILYRDDYRCVRCHRKGRYPRRKRGQRFVKTGPYVGLHVHHITSLSHGGTNNKDNLQTLCINCHEAAHGRHLAGARR
jgi:5-methylcytosine-specific restriction endonuclease McrA